MKKIFNITFILFSIAVFSQKKVAKQIQIHTNQVNIYTTGLDDLKIENSNKDIVEVILYAESYDDQLVKITENSNEVNINFHFEGTETREVIFRKFITKRLQRAEAVIKIPKGKKITVFGENVDIETKNCKNNLAIFIDNGIVKLNTIQQNTELRLYAGNVYAKVKDSKINVISNIGKIKVNDITYKKEYKLIKNNAKKKLKIQSIKANIFITTQ